MLDFLELLLQDTGGRHVCADHRLRAGVLGLAPCPSLLCSSTSVILIGDEPFQLPENWVR